MGIARKAIECGKFELEVEVDLDVSQPISSFITHVATTANVPILIYISINVIMTTNTKPNRKMS